MPYVAIFLGMPYVIHVNDLAVEHVVSLECLCGGGPWSIGPYWLRSRYSEHEFMRWIFEPMEYPACGAVGGLLWQTFTAEPPPR